MVDVAQLVRASVCGTEGCGFKSHLPPQNSILLFKDFFFYAIINKYEQSHILY